MSLVHIIRILESNDEATNPSLARHREQLHNELGSVIIPPDSY